MGFALRRGISFCLVGERTIFLDLPADRYFCLSPAVESSFTRLVAGGGDAPENDQHVYGLVERGLLVATPHAGSPCPCPSIPIPEASMLDAAPHPSSCSGIGLALCSLVAARVRTKVTGLARALSWLETRKANVRPCDVKPRKLDQIVADFIGASHFMRLHDNCLTQSLAVAARMIANGLLPEVVLGVQLGPFAAHCWVQCGNRLVNDRFDTVRTFTPILVV